MRLSRGSGLNHLLACALALSGCHDPADGSSGPGRLATWSVASTPSISIGTVDGDPAYIFSRISSVRLLSGGRILVADRSSGTLRVFDEAGRLESQMGGVGQGPGEFSWLGQAFGLPPDTIGAYDGDLFRLSKFLSDGRLVSALTFHAQDGNPEIYLGRFADGSHGVAWIHHVPLDPHRLIVDRMRMARYSADGSSAAPLGQEEGMRRVGSPLPFSPSFMAVMVGDTVFHSDGVGGLITATGPEGDTVRAMDVSVAAIAFPEALQQLEAVLDSGAVSRLAELRRQPGIDTIPTISDMLVGPTGRLWVKKYAPATDSHWVLRLRTGGEWLVVGTDGTPVARVEMPEGFRLMDIGVERLAGVARDELGVERVEVYMYVGEPSN